MPISISDYYDLGSKNVIQFVFNEYERIFISSELQKNINVVKWDCEYALAAPKRQNPDQQVDYIIYLTAKSSYWCQIIYQFAHELSHLVMKCYPESKEYKWISECFCAAASNYMLELSEKYFISNFSSYVPSVRSYLQTHMENSKLPKQININQYIHEHMHDLEEDPTEDKKTERARNNAIAVYLLDIIRENEQGWTAIELFEQLDKMKLTSLFDFIENWKILCRNNAEEEFVVSFLNLI